MSLDFRKVFGDCRTGVVRISILVGDDGKVKLVIGAAGGTKIITSIALVRIMISPVTDLLFYLVSSQ